MSKKTAILDLTGCKYLGELHHRIKETLDFPDYYGENWDAFWDCINVDCDVDIVTIKGSNQVAEELNPDIATMLELLEANKQYWAGGNRPFDYEIVD